jgi:23S rRNA pseudouridine2457 synthase
MLIVFNKPYGVICQFSPSGDKPTLKRYIHVPNVYPAGRLDTDSEGLLLLTDVGPLQARIAHPRAKLAKTYLAQVEGDVTDAQLAALKSPLNLGDFVAQPASQAYRIDAPVLWERVPPIRFRAAIPTNWICLEITEGKNRQVRRMTAKVGLPTLRLVRTAVSGINLLDLKIRPGEWQEIPESTVLGPRIGRKAGLGSKSPQIE